uniref:OsmC-like protein n=1 Tax=Pseudo-nitzschia australis TaxID=44445 RepID=A0A7S4AJZ8_9STRA
MLISILPPLPRTAAVSLPPFRKGMLLLPLFLSPSMAKRYSSSWLVLPPPHTSTGSTGAAFATMATAARQRLQVFGGDQKGMASWIAPPSLSLPLLSSQPIGTKLFSSSPNNPAVAAEKSATACTTTATKSYSLEGSGTTGTSVTVSTSNTGHQITTDVPKTMGGQNSGPQPVELLLASWMGCTQATASFVGRQLLLFEKQQQQQEGEPQQTPARRRRSGTVKLLLEFENIQAFRDERGALELPISKTPEVPSRLQRITGRIRVAVHLVDRGIGNGEKTTVAIKLRLDPEELQLLKKQTEYRCPIANMILASGCEIDVEWMQEDDE